MTGPGPAPLGFRRALAQLDDHPPPPIDATPEAVERANAEEVAYYQGDFWKTLRRYAWGALFAGVGTAASVLVAGIGWAVYQLWTDRARAARNAEARRRELAAWEAQHVTAPGGAQAPAGLGEQGRPAEPPRQLVELDEGDAELRDLDLARVTRRDPLEDE